MAAYALRTLRIISTIIASASVLLVSHAQGGTITISSIVLEGDTVAGVGNISSGFSASEALAVNDSGTWHVESDTNNADTEADGVVLEGTGHTSGTLYLREGQAVDPPGASIDSFDAITINNAGNGGHNFFLNGTKSIFDDSGVYLNDDLIIQEGTIATAAGFSPNTPYIGWFEVKINNSDQLLMLASVDDPAIATTVDRALVVIDDPGKAATQIVYVKEGDELLPGRLLVDVATSGPHIIAFNDNAAVLYSADLDGDTTTDEAIFVHDGEANSLLAREGDPSPVRGRNWGNVLDDALDLNDAGDWAIRADLDGATADDTIIARNGLDVIAREGSGLPAIGSFTFTSFGTGGVAIDDNANVFWYGDWNDPNTMQDTGLFVNDQLIVQKGVTMVDGMTLTGISAVQDNFSVSDNGQWLVFEGTLNGTVEGAFLVEIPQPCPADLDGDDDVDIDDLFTVIAEFGSAGPDGDIDNDGDVDIDDLFLVIAAWGDC